MTITVVRFDGDRAVLRTEDGHEWIVPAAELPAGTIAGGVFTVHFTAAEMDDARAQRAKDILNEILGDETKS